MTTTATGLPPEAVIVALEDNAQQAYVKAMRNFARLTVVHLAIIAKRIDPAARYVLLDDSDQTIGDYVVIGLEDADGNELREGGDAFQDVPLNICDDNLSAWEEFIDREVSSNDHPTLRPPYYLDIDKVIETYPTWETQR